MEMMNADERQLKNWPERLSLENLNKTAFLICVHLPCLSVATTLHRICN